ncbi:hypothetical protein WJX72_009375 [[Myrmecia] bisecta]|uniref:PHD-type domain-containing protein n=1 Tax=[Myrmecia] bisecta TaxID=41462 RepID=A0AAW1QS79_9CHLO
MPPQWKKKDKSYARATLSDGCAEERTVAGPFNLNPAGFGVPSEGLAPLRILDNYSFFVDFSDSGEDEQPVGLDELVDGLVNGLELKARGAVLEHKLAAQSIDDARYNARVRVRIHAVRDWLIDYSTPWSIWVVTDFAWYRLLTPAEDYSFYFVSTLRKAQLAHNSARIVLDNPVTTSNQALAQLVSQWQRHGGGSAHETTAGEGFRPYAGIDLGTLTNEIIQKDAGFLLSQLALFLGRHASKCEFLQALAAAAGISLADVVTPGRRIRRGPSGAPVADLATRPQPQTGFFAAAELLPGILMVWDFCQSYRALLRLPPFPMCGAAGQAALLRDIHAALLRLVEGLDEELMEAPTMEGYGSAADLAPQEAYRPLLGVTWPEMVRICLENHDGHRISPEVSAAMKRLKAAEYEQLSAAERLVLLEAVMHVAADMEVVRNHIVDTMPEATVAEASRGQPFGWDGSGNRYYQLGGDTGHGNIFVESADGTTWGWYELEQIPQLMDWLEGGCDAEQDLAEDIYEAFEDVINASANQDGAQPGSGSVPEASPSGRSAVSAGHQPVMDGYLAARQLGTSADQLRSELQGLMAAVRFWDKDLDWWQARAAVLELLTRVQAGREFAKLMWLVEDLMYDDLLKGTGWGRRRGWYREQLEDCQTVSQAAMVCWQLAAHCRRAGDMGFLTRDDFYSLAQQGRYGMTPIPHLTDRALFLKSAYAFHLRRQQAPGEPKPPPIPADWRFVEPCSIVEAAFVQGLHGPRIGPTGRFGPASASSGNPDSNQRLVAWLLIRKDMPAAQKEQNERTLASSESGDAIVEGEGNLACGEINWRNFSFQHGFRTPPRVIKPLELEDANGAAVPADGSAAASVLEAGASRDGSPTGPSAMQVDEAEAAEGPEKGSKRKREGGAQTAISSRNGGIRAVVKPDGDGDGSGSMLVPGAHMNPSQSADQLAGLDEEGEGGLRVTRSSRRTAGVKEFFMLGTSNTAIVSKEAMAASALRRRDLSMTDGDDDNLYQDDDVKVRYWLKDRGFAVVAVHLKPLTDRPPQFFFSPPDLLRGADREWPAGLAVKMPSFGTPAEQADGQRRPVKWYAGTLQETYVPMRPQSWTPGEAQAVDPWKALHTEWEFDVPPGWPTRQCTWEVEEDTNGSLRQEKARIQAEETARRNLAMQINSNNRRAWGPQAQQAAKLSADAAHAQANMASGSGPVFFSSGPSGVSSAPAPQYVPVPYMHQVQGGGSWTGQAGGAPGGPTHFMAADHQAQMAALAAAGAANMGSFQALLAGATEQAPPSWVSGQEPVKVEKKKSGAGRKRKADRDGSSDNPAAKRSASEGDLNGRVKTPKPPSEGYRERWLAKKPRPTATTWCSTVCSACEGTDGDLVVCSGPCLRAFHPACVGLQAKPEVAWFCPECDTGRVRCFVCGEFGAGFEDPTVRKCSLGVCGRFYHLECVAKLDLTHMGKKGAHFRCPQHYCHVCNKSGDGIDMVKCIRCPTAYHTSCTPKTVHRFLSQSKVVLCEKHQPGSAPPGYTHPPPASGEKLEAALAAAKAAGIPLAATSAVQRLTTSALSAMNAQFDMPQAMHPSLSLQAQASMSSALAGGSLPGQQAVAGLSMDASASPGGFLQPQHALPDPPNPFEALSPRRSAQQLHAAQQQLQAASQRHAAQDHFLSDAALEEVLNTFAGPDIVPDSTPGGTLQPLGLDHTLDHFLDFAPPE